MDKKKENEERVLQAGEEMDADEVYEELEYSDQAVISGIVHHLNHPDEAEKDC